MKIFPSIGWMLLALGSHPSDGQPQIYNIGLVFTDQIDQETLPLHLQQQHPAIVKGINQDARKLFADLGRFRTLRLRSSGAPEDPFYHGAESVDYIAHFILNKAYKTYHNQVNYFFYNENAFNQFDDGGVSKDQRYEVVSKPAIVAQLEVKLVDPRRKRIFWSDLRDSSATIPYDDQLFLYNTWKYPGASHPGLIRAFLADLLRLQMANPSVERALNVAERWFVSTPNNDLAVARGVLKGLAVDMAADTDANLPLEGRIAAILPQQKGKCRVQLNIGARHGLASRMRLDVWRPEPSQQKVGQLEVVATDSTTAIAKLRKLDKKLKKSGEGLQLQDRVISAKRPSRRSL